jgi:hypothetical protein
MVVVLCEQLHRSIGTEIGKAYQSTRSREANTRISNDAKREEGSKSNQIMSLPTRQKMATANRPATPQNTHASWGPSSLGITCRPAAVACNSPKKYYTSPCLCTRVTICSRWAQARNDHMVNRERAPRNEIAQGADKPYEGLTERLYLSTLTCTKVWLGCRCCSCAWHLLLLPSTATVTQIRCAVQHRANSSPSSHSSPFVPLLSLGFPERTAGTNH